MKKPIFCIFLFLSELAFANVGSSEGSSEKPSICWGIAINGAKINTCDQTIVSIYPRCGIKRSCDWQVTLNGKLVGSTFNTKSKAEQKAKEIPNCQFIGSDKEKRNFAKVPRNNATQ